MLMGSKYLNVLGEFSDYDLEKKYFQQEIRKAISNIKPIVLILGILFVLFLIPDYFIINNNKVFIIIAISRFLFVLLILALFIRIKHIKDYKEYAKWVTIIEVLSVIILLLIFYQYTYPNFLIQAFGVMVIILAVFMLPNRWINMIIVSVFICAGFILLSTFYSKGLKFPDFMAGIVYLVIVIMLCSINTFSNHYSKRIQYINGKELMKLSKTDPLTGAFNRVKLDEELKRWVAYSKRYNTPLSLVIIDFDDFKKVNDTYGHQIGDIVISESANLIKNNIRETDVFARWGGEEFIILFPNTDIDKSIELAERLRKKIEKYHFDETLFVTCSFGVAQLSSDDDIASFICKADKMLYAAKGVGKNTVKS